MVSSKASPSASQGRAKKAWQVHCDPKPLMSSKLLGGPPSEPLERLMGQSLALRQQEQHAIDTPHAVNRSGPV